MPEQQRIVAVLDEAFVGIAAARASAERNLRNARALFESEVAAAFSQVGVSHRDVSLADVCEITSSLVDPREMPFADMLHVGGANMTPRTGELVDLVTARDEGLTSGKFTFDQGVVLYSKIRPYLMKAARPDFTGLCSADVYPITAEPSVLDAGYLFHLLLSPRFTGYAVAGSARAGMPKVNREHLFAYRFSLPPVHAQRAVAQRLDNLAESTGQLSEIYQRKLAALDELKRSLLHHAFTGQLTASRPKLAPARTWGRPMSPTDRHAGVLAIAYKLHADARRTATFGHVKAEKIAHMVEAHLGIDLGRTPVKDAAGPNDFACRKQVDQHAKHAGQFDFVREEAGNYRFVPLEGLDELVERTRHDLGPLAERVDHLVGLMLPMRTFGAEIFATTYAAWNNLLLDGQPVTEEAIVREARENWHPDKLKIPRDRFFRAIAWMRAHDVTPSGRGERVTAKPPSGGRECETDA